MEMKKLAMCRICLVEDVRMYVVVNENLQALYEKLTDVPFVTEDHRPMLACFFCCAKLKQCEQFQRKCLEAEELFAQMLNEDYESSPLTNHGHIKFYGGFIRTAMEYTSIDNECLMEQNAIKEELPAVCEIKIEFDGTVEPKEEELSDEFEQKYLHSSYPDVEDIPAHHSEDGASLVEFKIEVEEEQDVTMNSQRASETEHGEENYLHNNCQEIEDVPPNCSEADSDENEPLIQYKSEVEQEKEIPIKIQKSSTKHTLKNTSEKPYKCKICQCGYNQRSGLIRHKRIHTGEKPYKCEICQRCFIDKSILIRHIRIHTGEKPYKCEKCQRGFSIKGDLNRHVRIHTDEKPFKCEKCHRSFSQEGDLTKHSQKHDGDKPHKCEICQRCFSKTNGLNRHIRIHTGEKPYKCERCLRSFGHKSTLTKHICVPQS